MKVNINMISKRILENKHFNITVNNFADYCKRNLSTSDAAERRSHLFTLEKKRQREQVGRIEKIEVQYKGLPNDAKFIMNKDLSTPYDCARHLSQTHMERSVLALINESVYWDMNKPLTENCTLELQHLMISDPHQVNKAFWRTCSFLLGACASVAFKDNVVVKPHSFPGPDVRSGSFVCDVDLQGLSEWQPSEVELRTLSAEFIKLCTKKSPLERLDIAPDFALVLFQDNEHKLKQIPSIAAKSKGGKITVYRAGQHVDMSHGPMISNTAQIGRATVTGVHTLDAPNGDGRLFRFQGVALPVGFVINHFAYGILENRGKNLNPARSPFEPFTEYGDGGGLPDVAGLRI